MIAQRLIALTAGCCQNCGGPICKGDEFIWGPQRGERVHVQCPAASEQARSAIANIIDMRSHRKWSTYQQAVFEFGVHGTGSAIIQAVAGSGKTNTIEELCRRLPADSRICYLVFNRRNADEACARMPPHVNTSTFHAACNSALSQHLNHPQIERNKTRKILQGFVREGYVSESEAGALGASILKLVGLAKNHGVGTLVSERFETWESIIEHFGIDFDSPEDCDEGDEIEDAQDRGIEISREVLRVNNTDKATIDFDDMLYQTVRLRVSLPRYEIVMVDEAQDTNAIQRAIIRMMLAPGGRLIAVGDRRQALYGFRGADANAMSLIATEFGCQEMALSINYRCSKAVIERAKQSCSEIEAHEGAPEGSVLSLNQWKMQDFLPSDAILCRVNAPLITLAYRLIGNGIRCKVLGRDIGDGLVALIGKIRGRSKDHFTIDDLEHGLARYAEREIAKWTAKGQEEKAQSVQDKVESIYAAIQVLPETSRTVDALIDRIVNLFEENSEEARLTLSTVHKSKGLEWERVFILDPSRMPSPWARQKWQQEQEQNCIYVAVTRAKRDLRYIESMAVSDS